MTQIIAVTNHKGGVGKTTSAVNIAACWGYAGEKVLLVDLDPQGSATVSLGIKDDGKALLDSLQKTTALPVVKARSEGFGLVPSGPGLADARQRFTGTIYKELLLRCLKRTPGDWDRVIIDCPPGMEVLTMTALWAGTHIVVPVETSYLALGGLAQMMDTVRSVDKRPPLVLGAVIPCRVHPRRRMHCAAMEQLEKLFPGGVSPAVRENVALAEAPATGKPVVLSAPRSNGAEDYRQVALWLLERLDRS